MTDVNSQKQETNGFPQVPQVQQVPQVPAVVPLSINNVVYPPYPPYPPHYNALEQFPCPLLCPILRKDEEEDEEVDPFSNLINRLLEGEEVQVVDALGNVRVIKMVKDSSITKPDETGEKKGK